MPPLSSYGLLDRFLHGPARSPAPMQPALPLQGITLLAVEDSRYASEALRLLCHRSGARLRRVDRLHAAYNHLRVYRPDVMLIDIGLPDGRGDTLIRDLTTMHPHQPIIIAISGDPDVRADALGAGAHGFLEKPFPGLAAFQAEILRYLPDQADRAARAAATSAQTTITPDRLALQDDLEHAAEMINANPNVVQRRYLSSFISGIARSANDPALAAAASGLTDADGLDQLCRLLSNRINAAQSAFDVTAP